MTESSSDFYLDIDSSFNEMNDRKHVCPKCPKRYKHKKHLTYHLRHQCGLPPKFQCQHCDQLFQFNSSLNYHLAAVHFTFIDNEITKK